MKKHYKKWMGSLCSSTSICLMALQGVTAQTPVDASDGIDFGPGANDPKMKKGASNTDLQVEVADGSGLTIYSGGNTKPTFLAGEGHEGSITSGSWYRIAKSTPAGNAGNPKRCNAVFSLRDDISGGGHSTVVFRAGMSYGEANRMGLTLLSHTSYGKTTFTEVRILYNAADIYDEYYLEVKVNSTGAARYSISDNLSNGAWIPVDWVETPTIPTGYTDKTYDIDKVFMVGDSQSIFSISRGGGVDIDGTLNVLSSPVLTQATAPSLLAGQYVERSTNNEGSSDSLLLEGSHSGLGAIPVEGAGSRIMWYPEKSAFRVGEVTGTQWNNASTGNHSVAMGYNTTASGDYSFAVGEGSSASGLGSTAMGKGFASGDYSTAMGWSGASGLGSTAMGKGFAIGDYSTAMGTSHANGDHSTAMGSSYVEYGVSNATAMGSSVILDGIYATAMGRSTLNGFYATAMGRSGAYGDYATAMGKSFTSADYATAMGASHANSDYATAMGQGKATGNYSTAIGPLGTEIHSYSATAIGSFNENRFFNSTAQSYTAAATAWQGDDQHSVFEVGIGTSPAPGDRKNALTVLQDGSVEVGKNSTDDSIPLHIKADGSVILSKAQGDISMGVFGP